VGHGPLDGDGWNGPASKLPEECATRRLDPQPSHEPTTRRMGHPACQVYWEDGAYNVISSGLPKVFTTVQISTVCLASLASAKSSG